MYLKKENGVTLTILVITVIVMLLISSTIIYNTNTHVRMQRLNKLYQDIETINKQIDDYYLRNGELPIFETVYCTKAKLNDLLTENANLKKATLNTASNNLMFNPNDGNDYYLIDLGKLGGIILNYGYGDDYENASKDPSNTSYNEVFIINDITHQVYYPAGVFLNGFMYYSYNMESDANINVTIPEIKTTITGLKHTGKKMSENTVAYDDSNNKVTIPKNFNVAKDSATDADDGIVVIAPDGSEFVWIPVPDITKMYGTTSNGKKLGKLYEFTSDSYTQLNWTEKDGVMELTDTEEYREPDILINKTYGDASENSNRGLDLLKRIVGVTNTSDWQIQLQKEFDEMIDSISNFGGFYVGRYEMSLTDGDSGEQIAQSKKDQLSATAEEKSANTWYGLYQKAKEYGIKNINDIVGSSMIWGSQYDQIMMWMQNSGNGINVASSTPKTGVSYNPGNTTGSEENDKLNNIYDLLGNTWELTLEAYSNYIRVYRRICY